MASFPAGLGYLFKLRNVPREYKVAKSGTSGLGPPISEWSEIGFAATRAHPAQADLFTFLVI
jgi:hypothetical protein